MKIIESQDCVSAWKAGASHLLSKTPAEEFNLITTIGDPTTFEAGTFQAYNPRAIRPDADPIRDVVNTIFPMRLRARPLDAAALYDAYRAIHLRGQRRQQNRSRWGTYFERLISFPGPSGPINQLDVVIQKLRTWTVRSATALVIHTNSAATDSPRKRGGPCWQFGEIVWHANDTLDLVVVYRNHDFFNKTLGNFIALGQLLRFICEESGKEPGKLICHSIHAYFDGPKADMKSLANL